MTAWEINASYVEKECGCFVDWEERFYTCPYCGDIVYECDWSNMELVQHICPICEDEEGDDEG